MTDDAVAAKAGEYLRKPYYRVVLPEEDGTWRGEIIEFPGCIATGQTREEALQSLEETAISWLSSAIAHGQSIPEPLGERDHSGRLVLRLPRSLHKKAALAAELDGVSLNQFISNAVAEAVGERRNAVALGSVWSPENTTNIGVELHKWLVDAPVSFKGTNPTLIDQTKFVNVNLNS